MHPFLVRRRPIDRICPQFGLLANGGVSADRFVSTETWMSCDRRQVEPEQHDLNMITSDPERVAELRGRLTNLYWFMRGLNEPIAGRRTRMADRA